MQLDHSHLVSQAPLVYILTHLCDWLRGEWIMVQLHSGVWLHMDVGCLGKHVMAFLFKWTGPDFCVYDI